MSDEMEQKKVQESVVSPKQVKQTNKTVRATKLTPPHTGVVSPQERDGRGTDGRTRPSPPSQRSVATAMQCASPHAGARTRVLQARRQHAGAGRRSARLPLAALPALCAGVGTRRARPARVADRGPPGEARNTAECLGSISVSTPPAASAPRPTVRRAAHASGCRALGAF